jgi:putative CocE/NonD family hydrolase
LVAQSTDHCDFPLHDDDTTVPDYWSDPDVLDDFIAGPYLSPTIEFYERFLKGRDIDLAPVRWHLANADWRTAASWPPEGVRSLRLFLGDVVPQGAAGGVLSAVRGGSERHASWVHDPSNMVPTDRDGDDTAQLLTGLPDERRVEDRDDVLTFTSDPFDTPLDLAGLVRLSGSVGSSHTSMQLVLKLIDVLPSGRARAIAERAVHVDDVHPERHIDVDIGFAGYRLGEGHSVRLEVASSAFPKYIWHPGTDEDPWTAVTGTPNEQFVRVGGSASFLEIDVLPSG